ncbi:MAG: hypothetical protein ABS43_25615 [Bordetella sp. SCN 67-23]|nr:amidohydrolase family protein [Burkholderiales bacterium]ODS69461.1 MAG: hypothetical protein ABS43_25615 [Bordetella sp. SCN 67-23]ODU76604.1 MAG: hypothetical protein ABT00_15105 [Bordetella sp. SCN 68-11]OJW92297.1 MAG: hypothetical protein BGO71_07305 [Burkholderiales bacterium 67-32]
MANIDLDVHAHLAPINPARLAGLPGARWLAQEGVLELDGHRIGLAALFRPERLLAWMDEHGIGRALVSIPPPLYRQELDAPRALEWAGYVNDELLALGAAHDRFGPMLHLPLEHPGLLDELCARHENAAFEGVALAAGGRPDILYSSSVYEPLWRWLDRRRAFVFLHPGACGDGRLSSFYLENLVGNPYETAVAATHLVMAGVPARFPGIQFCLAHAGGVFASLVGRLERGFDTDRPGVDQEVERPLQAARRFQVDCIAHHPSMLRLARDVFGEHSVRFGSDWPFPMGTTP